ncbi:MAG: phosphate:Na+ symporter [Paraglaciecola sp.]|jgi:phosphate:Na+ symporter
MMTLVAFHSSFNLLGIFIFLPFLGVFARFLERRFLNKDHLIAEYIKNVPTSVPEAAIVALQQEVQHLVRRIFVMNLSMLKLKNESFHKESFYHLSPTDQYDNLKELEGEIAEFQLKIQQGALESDTAATLAQLTDAIRYAMSSAKGIKDIAHNITDFSKSANDDLNGLLQLIKQNQADYYNALLMVFQSQHPQHYFEKLSDLKKLSKVNYSQFLEKAYAIILSKRLTDIEISTLFNVNREIHSSNKSLVLGIKDLLLEQVQAKGFEF